MVTPPPINLFGGTPNSEIVKINFDGSCNHSSSAPGFILRDWTGKLVIKLGATNYGHTSSLVAKARALKDGLRVAIQAC